MPVDDVARGDVADALGSEVRDDLVVDHVLLGGPCALAQIGAHVIGVDSDEVREPHVEGALRTAEKLRFEALGVLARGEPALALVPSLAIDVLVAELSRPGAVLLLARAHR